MRLAWRPRRYAPPSHPMIETLAGLENESPGKEYRFDTSDPKYSFSARIDELDDLHGTLLGVVIGDNTLYYNPNQIVRISVVEDDE